MKLISLIVLSLCLILWPLNLYLANTHPDFLSYLVPTLLLSISFFLYKNYPKYYLVPILFVGIFEKKLLLLPVLFYGLEIVTDFAGKKMLLFMISLILVGIYFPAVRGQTIFIKDYQAEQLVLRNIQLYPTVATARLFQNKPRIYITKLADNFFALTDLNNYFFGLHPRPITVNNQNLFKYPFVAVVFFLYGVFYLKDSRNKKFITISLLSSLICLTTLQNFDRNDFILWLPISLIIIHGINRMSIKNKELFEIISILVIIFAVPELIRSFVQKGLITI